MSKFVAVRCDVCDSITESQNEALVIALKKSGAGRGAPKTEFESRYDLCSECYEAMIGKFDTIVETAETIIKGS